MVATYACEGRRVLRGVQAAGQGCPYAPPPYPPCPSPLTPILLTPMEAYHHGNVQRP